MNLKRHIALLTILATLQMPSVNFAASEDAELAQIAADQNNPDEELGDINPALTDTITSKRTNETDKDVKRRKKKLQQTRKEKEKVNERRLKENSKSPPPRSEDVIIIDPNEPEPPPPPPPTITPPSIQPVTSTPPQPQFYFQLWEN